MTKQFLSAFLSLALAAASVPVAATAVMAEDQTDTGSLSESVQGNVYSFFYEDIDTTEIDRVIMEKRDEYVHSLYETLTDQNEIDKLDVDFTHSLRLEMLKAAYSEKSAMILDELGVDPSKAFCSMFTPMIVCELTDSQLQKAEKMELIKEISPYAPMDIEETTDKMKYANKEEFIKLFSTDKDGEYLFDGSIKVDAKLDCAVELSDGSEKLTDYLIIYGLPNEAAIKTAVNRLNCSNVMWGNPIEDYCGCEYSIISNIVQSPNTIRAIFFIEDEYPGWATKESPASFSERVGFDVAPYIVCKGDINGDYSIDAVDASEILNMYARLSTDNLAIGVDEFKHFDVNSDGAIDADDASIVLAYYSFLSTGGDTAVSLKEFSARL